MASEELSDLKMFVSIALVVVLCIALTHSFRPQSSISRKGKTSSLNMALGGLAELSIAAKLASADMRAPVSWDGSMVLSKVETKQGMYKEYTVDIQDDSALDQIKRGYKTADETEDSKGKYWAILAVLLFGSFAIPMVQYYWYVAEED